MLVLSANLARRGAFVRPVSDAALVGHEIPACSFRIALDVSKRNGINISPTRHFGSFVPERLFQTEDLAFHRAFGAERPQGEIPRANRGFRFNGCSRTPSGGEIK